MIKTFEQLKNTDHPWGNFLYARARAMRWMRDEMGDTHQMIAFHMSMDETQVELILKHYDGELEND